MGHLLAPGALAELDDIWYYVAKESGSFDIADRLLHSLTDRFYLLSRNPYLGRARNDLRVGLRSFPVGTYVILYRIHQGDAIILHVLRGGVARSLIT
jgi:toxin ParE1/3/4